MTDETPKQQLQMIFPPEKLGELPEVTLPAGYAMRTYRPDDEQEFVELMHSAGFEFWTADTLKGALLTTLPEGVFLIVHEQTGALAATTMATHNPTDSHPSGGELGWVAAHPDHQGKALGMAACVATMRRYVSAGYTRIYLKTDDWRLPALKIYLKLGFLPFLFLPDMEGRWRDVCEKLSWPFTPEQWPSVPVETEQA